MCARAKGLHVPHQAKDKSSRSSLIRRVLIACLLASLLGVAFFMQRNGQLAQILLNEQSQLSKLLTEHPLPMLAGGFALYVLVTGLSLPGAAILTLFFSYLLQQTWSGGAGVTTAIVLVSFASTTGASCAFLLARYLFQAAVTRRLGPRLQRLNDALQREGPFYLFALRLIPVVPFFVINLAMGLTPLRLRTFWWISQLGMLPGTIAYVLVGASLPDITAVQQGGARALLRWEVVVAFAVLGLLPLAARIVVTWWRGRRASSG
jgi:uncharacterized membrane protein YdjX (TVP38/TMEM64 family)